MKPIIRAKRQANLIDQAENIFFERGYSKTSISDICKEVQCSRTTLYAYFESKENIYLAVVNKSFEQFKQHFNTLEISEKQGLVRVEKLVLGYLDFARQWPRQYQMILDFHMILRKIHDTELQVSEFALLAQCSYFDEVKKNAQLPLKLMIKEINGGQTDGSINSINSSHTHFINLWAYLIGITNLYTSSNPRNINTMFDVKMPHWEENTLEVVRLILS